MTDEEAMGRWFLTMTKPQLAVYNQRMVDALPYQGSPKWNRIREAASREFKETTKEAARLYELGMADIIALGEVSEATDELLTNYQNQVDVIAKIMERA